MTVSREAGVAQHHTLHTDAHLFDSISELYVCRLTGCENFQRRLHHLSPLKNNSNLWFIFVI